MADSFFMVRHRTKLLLLEFKGNIPHDQLLSKLRLIFNKKIEYYLITTDIFIDKNIRTYAFLQFITRIDVYASNIDVFLNNNSLKARSWTIYDKEFAFLYLLKTTSNKKNFLSNISNIDQYINILQQTEKKSFEKETSVHKEVKTLTEKQRIRVERSIKEFYRVLETDGNLNMVLLKKIKTRLQNYYYKKDIHLDDTFQTQIEKCVQLYNNLLNKN